MRTAALFFLVFGLTACGQSSASGQPDYYRQFRQAQDFAAKEKFAEAAVIFARLAQINPDDAEIWMALGRSQSRTKQYRAAAESYTRALALGGEYPGLITYRVARSYAQAGDKAQALAWLEKAVAVPYENRPGIAGDEAFDALHDDAAFKKLAGTAPKSISGRDQEWTYDLDYLAAEIKRMHYAYRSHPMPNGFEDEVGALRHKLPRMANAAVIPEIQRLLARLGDGHTRVQNESLLQIPLTFYDFSDGMFVIDAPADCGCIGDHLATIGATPVAAAVQKITPYLSVDNAMGVRQQAPAYLRYPDYLRAAGIATANDVTLSLEGARGKHEYIAHAAEGPGFVRRLSRSKAASAGPVPRYMQRMNENYWLEPLGGATVYFQFNQVMDASDLPIAGFAGKLRAALAPSSVRNLIIDMRHNGGGNLNLFTPLLRAIITFETTHEGAAIYVLTSRETFSAAQVFVNEVEHYTSAVIAGEPSSSRPNFIGESAPASLPFSGLDMTISTRYHQTDDQDQRQWIAPKIPVALSSADYFANRDPVMDAVMAAINAGRPAGGK